MELLKSVDIGEYMIKADGTYDLDPTAFEDFTDDIDAWIEYGYPLSDGRVVLDQVLRIVNLQSGATIDDKFSSLPDNDTKKFAGRELVFYLQKTTLTDGEPSVMTEDEYNQSVNYRQQRSIEARYKRWEVMISLIELPEIIFQDLSKIALVTLELDKYRNDYLDYDNRIMENFILGTDHAFTTNNPAYPRDVNFGTGDGIALNDLAFWDLPDPDEGFKAIVVGIITDTIITGNQYVN